MRKILLLSIIIIVAIAGCAQEPTGKFLPSRPLAACTEDWNCTDWSVCVRSDGDTGVQTRACTDINNCSTIANKPSESRICGLPKIASKEPSQMTLEISDLPKDRNWTVTETNTRSVEEVSEIERNLGYKKGFYVHYFSQYKENENVQYINVYNYVSIYPIINSAINMSFSFDSAKENYRVGSLYEKTNKRILSISELPDPNVGEFGIAYNVTVYDITGFRENIYTIAFTKWNVAEVITIEGSKTDYSFLRELAKIAEGKIA